MRRRRLGTSPRNGAFIPRCLHAKRLRSWAPCAACRWPRAAAAPTPCSPSMSSANGPRSRSVIGIIDPSSGTRQVLGRSHPLDAAPEVGYLPEERGLYPAMPAREAIAFMGALRGLPLAEGRRRADALLTEHELGEWAKKPIRTLSKGMAQIVQLLGTIVHKPRLIVLDEPFAGLDAINQAKLEELIRCEARAGVTIIFSTHVIAHAERLCEHIAIIASGGVVFDGSVAEARGRLRPIVRLRTRASEGEWRSAIPETARREGDEWVFELPEG